MEHIDNVKLTAQNTMKLDERKLTKVKDERNETIHLLRGKPLRQNEVILT